MKREIFSDKFYGLLLALILIALVVYLWERSNIISDFYLKYGQFI